MSNPIRVVYSNTFPISQSFAGLASSTAGVGQQSALVDTSASGYDTIRVYFKVALGTNPTANKSLYWYLLSADDATSPTISTDGATPGTGAITISTADQIYGVLTSSSTNQPYSGSFLITEPPKAWGIGLVHDTAAALNTSGSLFSLEYIGALPTVF